MNSFYLLEHPEVFQGSKKLNSNTKCYFEGWYFKNVSKDCNISFIPGIQIENDKKSAFIQVITNNSSYYISYSFSEFKFSYEPFSISIGENYFSLNSIKLNIEQKDLTIKGELFYNNHIEIQKNLFSPNIMGAFCFLPFMECNHCILSMKHDICGNLSINDISYDFSDGIGYIEKDWGTSFPSSYIWSQANEFKEKNCSFFLSIANIPYSIFSFNGFICSLILNNIEYRFATYNSSKILSYRVSKNNFNIKLKNKDLLLHIYSNSKDCFSLKSPKCGAMKNEIKESINSKISVCLYEKEKLIFEDSSINCGLEIVI